MNKNQISRIVNITKQKTIKNGPKILLGVSIVSGVAAIAFAIKATRDIDPVFEYADEEFENIKKYREVNSEEEYTPAAYRKDKAIVYGNVALNFAQLYWPTAVFEAVSIATACASFGIMNKRLVSATAFGASIFAEFTNYRSRVCEKYGEQAEYELYNNIHQETVETHVDNGKGKNKVTKEVTDVVGDAEQKSSAFFVGRDYCKNWEESWSREANKDFLKLRISQAEPALNRELASKGYVHLSRIMELCDVRETDLSRHLAITYDPYYDPYSKLDRNGNPTAQIHLDIHDAGLLEGDEKVLLVTVEGLKPFNVDDFDYASLFKSEDK